MKFYRFYNFIKLENIFSHLGTIHFMYHFIMDTLQSNNICVNIKT